MERLTYDFSIGGNHCWQVKGADNLECREVCQIQGDKGCKDCPIAAAFDRLAAYEDTGLIPEEVKQMRWIPVEERKPKPSDNPILIYKSWDGRANFIGTAWYSSFHGWIPTNGTKIYGVTHWMSLPKAPKEEQS